MSLPTPDAGLSLDQAPPLSVPVAFFVGATTFVACAGTLLAFEGSAALASPWVPSTLALTHLGTFGFLGMVMMGALYQMTPVVAGARVRAIGLAHAVLLLGGAGLTMVVARLWHGLLLPGIWGFGLMALSVLLFAIPVAVALVRAKARSETVWGMRLALLSLVILVGLGIAMSHGWSGGGSGSFPGHRGLWIGAHLCVGFIGWIGALLSAVSWQVLPMFFLSDAPPRRLGRWILGGVVATLVGVLVALALERSLGPTNAGRLLAVAALPGAIAVWGIHPVSSLILLARRRRKRADPSLRFWQASMCMAPLCGLSCAAAWTFDDPRFALAAAWLLVWGWAGLVVHGMLTRIVPFLVWFHRFSHLVGIQPVPPLRRMLADAWIWQQLLLHAATLTIGVLAIALRSDLLSRSTGVGLILTALALARSLVHLLRQQPRTRYFLEAPRLPPQSASPVIPPSAQVHSIF